MARELPRLSFHVDVPHRRVAQEVRGRRPARDDVGIAGPLSHYGDTWQLVVIRSTTIVTFRMVFMISEHAKPRRGCDANQTRRVDAPVGRRA
ncbi:low affinity iron permease family protein [Paraburkholderia sp. MPAMCS5]|uniref:low affinity iron permease family protein n=1 Tax=Paraburkholderia sp. MPAMCS5 TaxID=3112563 RepID=UPI002E17E570|nr:low affinity iron permease family protein [Paraburkholderia sp. MPAMCS5]